MTVRCAPLMSPAVNVAQHWTNYSTWERSGEHVLNRAQRLATQLGCAVEVTLLHVKYFSVMHR